MHLYLTPTISFPHPLHTIPGCSTFLLLFTIGSGSGIVPSTVIDPTLGPGG